MDPLRNWTIAKYPRPNIKCNTWIFCSATDKVNNLKFEWLVAVKCCDWFIALPGEATYQSDAPISKYGCHDALCQSALESNFVVILVKLELGLKTKNYRGKCLLQV